MADRYTVHVGSGTLREDDPACVRVPHRWTEGGISLRGDFSSAHVLHLAVACCVLDDVHREAQARRQTVAGVHVSAEGGFETETGEPSGVEYSVAVDSGLFPEDVDALIAAVDDVAEIPRVLRRGVAVRRVGHV